MLFTFLRNYTSTFKKVLLLWLLCLSLNGVLASTDFLDTYEGRSVTFNALVDLLKENYWQEGYLDWDTWALTYRDLALNAQDRANFELVMLQMFEDIGDEHSSWLGRIDDLIDPNNNPFTTAEIGLGFRHSYIDGQGLVIQQVYPETPAYKVGLQRGDVIKALNGSDITRANLAVSSIFKDAIARGEVTVDVKRKFNDLTFTIQPEPIYFEVVSSLPLGRMLDATTGYLYIPTFNETGVAQRAHELVASLKAQGATSLIVDLRNNFGGHLTELGLLLGIFTQGTLAHAISRDGVVWETAYDLESRAGRSFLRTLEGKLITEAVVNNPVVFQGPLAILVSSANSSSGEIAPLVLQNLERAIIVGEPTNGNVEALRGFELPDNSVVLIAVANIESINGTSFSEGVNPDIMVSSSLEDLARGYDAPVAEAMRALKGLPFAPGKLF